MMFKDRLAALQEASIYRCLSSGDDGIPNHHGSLKTEARPIRRGSKYLDDFLSEAAKVREDINFLKENVTEVQKKHSAMLLVPVIDERLKLELDRLTSLIKEVAARIKGKLKDFEVRMERSNNNKPASAEVRIRRIQYETLSRMFVDVMIECNSAQTNYREKCKERFRRQFEIHGTLTTDKNLDDMFEEGSAPSFAVFDINVELLEAETILSDVEARHRDILNLEKSISELHSMFMDMAILVDKQGDMIDRIAYNVLNTVDFVEKAKQETRSALRKKRH